MNYTLQSQFVTNPEITCCTIITKRLEQNVLSTPNRSVCIKNLTIRKELLVSHEIHFLGTIVVS